MAKTKLLNNPSAAELLTREKFKIIVKTNAKENKIADRDAEKNAWRVEITAPPEKNKANIEIIKFLTKKLGKKVRIVSGLTSKEKICSTQD